LSGTLNSILGISGRLLEAQLVELAKNRIIENLRNGSVLTEDEMKLTLDNTPDKPPYQINMEEYLMPWGFDVEV